MLYTFALLRNPLKAVADVSPPFRHYYGGPLGERIPLDVGRFARVMTLDLSDPLLGFLRFPEIRELPLLMDFSAGAISYSVRADGSIDLHSDSEQQSESLMDEPLPSGSFRLEPIPYEQYRAAVFARAVIDDDFLSEADKECLRQLGESYTQVGGHHSRGYDYGPYCANPRCDGHGTTVTQLLATVSQEPAPGVSFDFLPDDPAFEFGFCMHCHCIVGSIAVD